MIIRTFPQTMLRSARRTFAPLFALYGNDERDGLLLEMLRQSDLDAPTFVRNNLIRPFVDAWLSMAISDGITTEPHAQNVLVELYDGILTGRFLFRDNGGVNFDEAFRKSHGLEVPAGIKDFGTLPTGNFSREHLPYLKTSLGVYFDGGFLFNLETTLARWQKEGHLPRRPSLKGRWAREILVEELNSALRGRTRKKISDDLSELPDIIGRLREKHAVKSCQRIFLPPAAAGSR